MEWLINRRRMMFNKAAPPAYLVFNDPVFWSMCCNNWGDYNEIVVTDNGDNTVNIVTTFKSMLNTTVKKSTVVSTQTNVDNSSGTYTAGTTKEAVGITAKQCAAVTTIPNNTFNSISNLVDVREFEYFVGLTELKYNFKSCPDLQYITIPPNVTYITECFGQARNNVTSIVFSENVTRLGSGVFYSPNNLQQCVILGDITEIGSSSFWCSNLTSFTIYTATPPNIYRNVFSGTPSSLKIYVPAESVDAYKAASRWSDYASKIEAIPQT